MRSERSWCGTARWRRRGRGRRRSTLSIGSPSGERRHTSGWTCTGPGRISSSPIPSSSGRDEHPVKVAIHQPQYLPWLGHFAKLAAADCWIFLDTVQYEKNGWQNRNRIKTSRGAQWLTVPVRARLGTLIRDVVIDEAQPWGRKHLEALRVNYARAPHFARYFSELERLLARPWRLLADLNVELTRFL